MVKCPVPVPRVLATPGLLMVDNRDEGAQETGFRDTAIVTRQDLLPGARNEIPCKSLVGTEEGTKEGVDAGAAE